MNEVNYNFSIITPLIISGFDKNSVELRIPSIKGILRWWFRFYKSSFLTVDELRKLENEVFGSTEKSCLFYMRLSEEPQNKEDAYLCMNDKRKEAQKDYSKIKRKAFSPSLDFKIKFEFSPHFKHQKEVENSLMLLSFFGGIGARWRRGFGSVQIKDFELSGNNLESLAQKIEEKIGTLKGSNKPDNFLSISNTKIYLIKPKDKSWNSWEDAMNDLRDNFYREFKNCLNVRKVVYKPSSGGREVSPLIIQIKKVADSVDYFGLILVWERWEEFEKFSSFLQRLEGYKKISIKL